MDLRDTTSRKRQQVAHLQIHTRRPFPLRCGSRATGESSPLPSIPSAILRPLRVQGSHRLECVTRLPCPPTKPTAGCSMIKNSSPATPTETRRVASTGKHAQEDSQRLLQPSNAPSNAIKTRPRTSSARPRPTGQRRNSTLSASTCKPPPSSWPVILFRASNV